MSFKGPVKYDRYQEKVRAPLEKSVVMGTER